MMWRFSIESLTALLVSQSIKCNQKSGVYFDEIPIIIIITNVVSIYDHRFACANAFVASPDKIRSELVPLSTLKSPLHTDSGVCCSLCGRVAMVAGRSK